MKNNKGFVQIIAILGAIIVALTATSFLLLKEQSKLKEKVAVATARAATAEESLAICGRERTSLQALVAQWEMSQAKANLERERQLAEVERQRRIAGTLAERLQKEAKLARTEAEQCSAIRSMIQEYKAVHNQQVTK